MKSNFVTDLRVGQEIINEPFLFQDVLPRKTKDGRSFILGTLRDRTGQIACVYWDIPEYTEAWVANGRIALVTGKIVKYKDALQISITDLNKSTDSDMTAFLPSSSRPREELLAELRTQIDSLTAPWQELASHILLDDAFLEQFANAPAARAMHHAYIGGLLDHTLSMAAIANTLADHYPHVNRDLLLTGTLLHDMGKTIEYKVNDSFNFSEDGRLVGHIIRAIVMVEQAAATINFPADKLQHLIHLIASHHGTLEWGSPVQPKTLEAILLHQIDLLDSRVQGYFNHLDNDNSEGHWTTKQSNMFGTELRYPDDYESGGSTS